MSLVNISRFMELYSKPVTFFNIFVCTSLILVLIYLKLVFKRWKYIKIYPGLKINSFNPLGSLLYLPKPKNGFNIHVLLIEIGSAFCSLLRKEKIFAVWILFLPGIVVMKPEAIEELISGSKMLKKSYLYKFFHPWLGKGLLTSDGSKWKSQRKLLTQTFHFDILKDFLYVFNANAEILIKALQREIGKEYVDIVTPVTLCSLDIICETTLGTSIKAQENKNSDYVKAVNSALKLITKRLISPWFWPDTLFNLTAIGKQFNADIKLLHDFTRKIIREKKKKLLRSDATGSEKKRKALIDILLEHHIQNKSLTEENIREEVDTFAFEGHDTTATSMSWALYLIGLNENVQAKLHEEMDGIFGDDVERPTTTEDLKDMEYLERVIKETLRLYPPVPIFARQAENDMELSGYPISKGAQCAVLPYALHRDEEIYPNPELFDPDRFLPEISAKRHPYAYLPFSAGSRNCIGQRFAMMEEKVVISHILRNFKLKSLDERDQILPSAEMILKPSRPIRIKLTSRL